MVGGVCRRLSSSSVTRHIADVTHQGQHAAGQSRYVPLVQQLITFWILRLTLLTFARKFATQALIQAGKCHLLVYNCEKLLEFIILK